MSRVRPLGVVSVVVAAAIGCTSSGFDDPDADRGTDRERAWSAPSTTTATTAGAPAGLRVDPPLPAHWTQAPGHLYFDIGDLTTPRAEVTVATFGIPPEPSPVCDYPVAALELMGPADAFVSVVDSTRGTAFFNARPDPASFLPSLLPVSAELAQGESDISPDPCLTRQPDFRFEASGFVENGRMVTVHVGIGLDASQTTEAQILQVVQQIVVEPRE